jgi:predicted nucleotidyltransferase
MRLSPEVDAALAPLEPGYLDLLARVVGHLAGDERVRAVWLSGSVGRGAADAGSDLDLVVTVTDATPWRDAEAWAVVDPVISIPVPGVAGLALTTREGLRLDVVLETPDEVLASPYASRLCLLDRDGFTPPRAIPTDQPPDVARMQDVVTEVLRQCAIFPAAVVAREDWLLGQVAVHQHQRMLYELLVEANRPSPPTGVKQWSRRLTPPQRDLMAALPAPAADRDSVVEAMVAVRTAFLTHGRGALESAGGVWPTEVDDAVAAYWERHGLPVR